MVAHESVRAAQSEGLDKAGQRARAVEDLRKTFPSLTSRAATRITDGVLEALAPYDLPEDGSVPGWVKSLVAGARTRDRAAGRQIPTIGERQVMELHRAQRGRCLVSGIPFSADDDRPRALVSRPFAPSLDRIDTTRGYEPGNVRLVCVAANFAMNAWGYDALLKLAEGVVEAGRDRAVP